MRWGRTCLERPSYPVRAGAVRSRDVARRRHRLAARRTPSRLLPQSFTCEPIASDRGFVSRGIESGGGARHARGGGGGGGGRTGRGERRGARLQKNRRRRVNGRAVALQLARVEQLARESSNVIAERNVRVGEVARLCAHAAEGALGGGEEEKDKDGEGRGGLHGVRGFVAGGGGGRVQVRRQRQWLPDATFGINYGMGLDIDRHIFLALRR